MKRYRLLGLILLCLSAVTRLGAQGYEAPDNSRFHASSAYFLTLQDANGASINQVFALTEGAIGAFVGDELRGVSRYQKTDANGNSVFLVRVWGDENDAPQVVFRLFHEGLEYQLGTQPFGCGEEATYGWFTEPLVMTLSPVTGLSLSPTSLSLNVGGTSSVKAILEPTTHSTLVTSITYQYSAGNSSNIFSVDETGLVTGLAIGEGQLTATAMVGEKKLFSANMTVTVTDTPIAVEGIRNNMPSLQLEKTVGDEFTLDFTILPENAADKRVSYTIADPTLISKTEKNGAVLFTALKVGTTTITVTTIDGNYSLVYTININKPIVHVTSITADPTSIQAYVGDEITYTYTVLPENADDKSVTVTIEQKTEVLKKQNDKLMAVNAGTATIVIRSNDDASISASITVTVTQAPQLTFTFASSAFTLSKLHDTTISLTASEAIIPNKMELVFSDAANGEPVATATMADGTGLRWTVRGQYVGQHTCQVKYNGELKQAKCNINIPAEFTFEQGWDWISLYAIGASGQLPLKQNDQWASWLRTDENNTVFEIRSQQAVLRYDPKYNYFGTLEVLRPADGTYKVYNEYTDENASKMVINVGYENLLKGNTLPQPKTQHGYTWMTYPHELDHSLEVLTPYLNTTAEMGDMIISRTGFVVFNGTEWIGDEDFAFNAGQGYIYYTEGEGDKSINWGPQTLKPENNLQQNQNSRLTRAGAATPWHYNMRSYSETMAIIASLDDISNANASIGAFVGNECRGEGKRMANGHWHIAVTGQPGETVTFRLYDLQTGELSQIGQKLTFASRAGSYREPLQLNSLPMDDGQWTTVSTYDLQGRRLTQCGQKGVYIINGKKVIK